MIRREPPGGIVLLAVAGGFDASGIPFAVCNVATERLLAVRRLHGGAAGAVRCI